MKKVFLKEIRQIMMGSGETQPEHDTLDLMHDLVVEYISDLVHHSYLSAVYAGQTDW
jgi:hypothetical protein